MQLVVLLQTKDFCFLLPQIKEILPMTHFISKRYHRGECKCFLWNPSLEISGKDSDWPSLSCVVFLDFISYEQEKIY